MLLPDQIPNFFAYLRIEKSASLKTIQAYRKDIESLIEYLHNNKISLTISDLKTIHIRSYMYYMHDQRRFSISTIRRKLYSLSSYLEFLSRESLLLVNPLTKIHIPKKKKIVPRFLSTSELKHLMKITENYCAAHGGHRDLVCIGLLRHTGARRDEVLDLKWENISFSRETIQIIGKGGKERILPLHPQLLEYLLTLKNHHNPQPWDFVIRGHRTDSLSRSSMRDIVKKYMLLSGFGYRQITPHKIRHSFACELLDKGVDIRIIQEWLGHESLNTTIVYTHVSVEQMRKACGPHSNE